MNFSFTEDQRELRENVYDFARRELESKANRAGDHTEFDRESWDKCGAFGIHGLMIPQEYGGLGYDALSTIGALEALGFGYKDNGLLFSINAHMWTCAAPILAFGTDAQKDRFLPGLSNGQLIGGNAMTEAESGSDAYSLRTTAIRNDDHYLLNGAKTFITNAPIADVLVVFATVDPSMGQRGVSAFLVETHLPGLTTVQKDNKLGIGTSPWGELYFEDCRIPVDMRLGKEGAGTALFTHSMTWERGLILATAAGAMRRQFDACRQYAKHRKQFGEPIANFQLVQSKLVDMKIRLETVQLLLFKLGWLRSQGKSGYLESAMTKLHISESWVQSSLDAVQIYGAFGYTSECDAEQELRDSIASRIYSGTSEVQRMIIGSLL